MYNIYIKLTKKQTATLHNFFKSVNKNGKVKKYRDSGLYGGMIIAQIVGDFKEIPEHATVKASYLKPTKAAHVSKAMRDAQKPLPALNIMQRKHARAYGINL